MTPGARKVLEELAADDDIDIVCEGWMVYCGDRQTTRRVVNELLEVLALSVTSHDGFMTATTYMGINDTGRALLRRPELEDEIRQVLHAKERRPFSIINDRVVPLEA